MVYLCQGADSRLVKIGYTGAVSMTALTNRLRGLQACSPERLVMIGYIPLPIGTHEHEQELHKRFRRWRSHGEWFNPAVLATLRYLPACIEV